MGAILTTGDAVKKRFTAPPVKTNSGTTGYRKWGQEMDNVQQQAIAIHSGQ